MSIEICVLRIEIDFHVTLCLRLSPSFHQADSSQGVLSYQRLELTPTTQAARFNYMFLSVSNLKLYLKKTKISLLRT